MKTEYKLIIGNKVEKIGTALQILAWAESYFVDSSMLQQALQTLQLGLHDEIEHSSLEPQYHSFYLAVEDDSRILDIIEAMQLLDPNPKLLVKQAALRAIAIAAQNDEKHANALALNLLHAFFLMA